MEREDRGCCATAWHCDEGEWYNPLGKGNECAVIYMLKWDLSVCVLKLCTL